MHTFNSMLKTELKLSLRGMDMILFAICMPLAILVILGILYGDKPAFPGAEYTFLQQSFGALSAISICAGGVMGLPLVVSDYRGKHILKRFQVTPISPLMILMVQLAIYTLYALASLLLLYTSASLFFGFQFQGNALRFAGGFTLVTISMFSIGMMVGGIAPNTKVASILASILYFPMLIFSGATLPYEVMPASLQKFADMLPLTQGIKLLKASAIGQNADQALIPALVMTSIAVICIVTALRFFKWE